MSNLAPDENSQLTVLEDDEMRAYKLKKQLESEDVEDEDEEGDDGDEEDSEDEEDDEVGEQQDEGVADARGVERKGGKSSRRHDTKDGTGQVIPAENVGKAIPHLRPECEDLPRAKRSRFG